MKEKQNFLYFLLCLFKLFPSGEQLQRFNNYSNACSYSFCGNAYKTPVEVVCLVEMPSKYQHFSFILSFENEEKSRSAKSGEHGG